MKIVVDENIPGAVEAFGQFGEVQCVAGRTLNTAAGRICLRDAEVLIVRSVSRVNEQLLQGSPVRFVGSATIGADHLDLDYLTRRGIAVTTAPGCNADSVVDYVLSVLCVCEDRLKRLLSGGRLGVIGYGNVGSRLAARLTAMGIDCIACDPLLPQTGRLRSLEQVLACDVVCLHTPLTRCGAYPSYHLLSFDQLRQLSPGALLLNAGRGEVLATEALLKLAEQRPDVKLALDVWEGEPAISSVLLSRCTVATPHIAGYSVDGKLAGTHMIATALADFLGEEFDAAALQAVLPSPPLIQLHSDDPADLLREAVLAVYDVRDDDRRLRAALLDNPDEQSRAAAFDALRKDYPLRRELSSCRFDVGGVPQSAKFRLLNAARGSR